MTDAVGWVWLAWFGVTRQAVAASIARPAAARPWIKSPLLSSFILLELLSNNASTCRELPFCPVAGIRDLLGIPDAAGAYRGIRANIEQTSVRKGLDHCMDHCRQW